MTITAPGGIARPRLPAVPVAVVVPTVPGREAPLEQCLAAVRAQTIAATEVVTIRGCNYAEAVRRGVERTTADWVAFLDDDSIPEPDWLETLARHLDSPRVGAVGGRILNFVAGRATARRYEQGPVARLSWYGRTESHLHDVPTRHTVADVDFLPGSNMCIRRAAFPELDERWEEGMAPGFETALFLVLRRKRWCIVFDSEAVVAHYPAPRPTNLAREDPNRAAYEYSFMLTYLLLRHLPWLRKPAFFAYFMVVGQRRSPGLLLAPRFLLRGASRSLFLAAWRGKLKGVRRLLA